MLNTWGIPEWLAYTWAAALFLGCLLGLTAYLLARD